MNWLCWHVGSCTDPKFKIIARRLGAPLSQVLHAWAYHLERAAQGEPRGTFGIIDPDEAELDTEIPRPIWMAVIIAFEEKALIKDGSIVNFDKRNYGNSTLRVRAFRERQKRLSNDETLQLTDETLQETLKRSCNATGQDRTGQTGHKNPSEGGNGHDPEIKNGSHVDLNPLRASRAFRNGEPTKAEKHALYEQRTLRFALVHYSNDQYAELVRLQLSDDPADKAKRKAAFNAADADYQNRKAAGTLQPMTES